MCCVQHLLLEVERRDDCTALSCLDCVGPITGSDIEHAFAPVPTADAPEVDTVASPSIVETLDGQVVSHSVSEPESDVEGAATAPVPAPLRVEGATDALAHELEIDAPRARYVAVVGRSTGSRDKRYLLWKIRLASQRSRRRSMPSTTS
jgi:hypothetical protein